MLGHPLAQDVQQRIIDTLREIGVTEQGFATEQFDGIKASSPL